MSIIKCENTAFGYGGAAVAENVNFSLEAGDALYIVGENGSGKSTLVKGILGLIPPFSGKITLGDGLTKRGIGYMPQKTDAQSDFPASVYEVVISGNIGRGKYSPFYSKSDRARACEAMTALGIHDIQHKSFRELSGGQVQRVLLSRALVAGQKLLVLDEPAAGLDVNVTKELYRIIDKLRREKNIAVIMVTHDMTVLDSTDSKVLLMNTSPVFYESTDAYFKAAGKETEEK